MPTPRGSSSRTRKAAATRPAAPARKPPARRAAPQPAERVSTHPPKHRGPETLAILDRLRGVCMALPGATEVPAWGELTWRHGKIFAMSDTYHHGAEHLSVHLPAPDGAQAALIDADPARFFRPPYTGHKGWIGVVLDTDPDWEMVAGLVRTAYDLASPPPRPARRRR